MTPTAIDIHDLTVSYGEKPVLWGIDVSIPRGIMAAIVGPNGAGKSSLLKTILGIITPTTGHVTISTHAAGSARGQIGYVPQRESVDWDFPVTALDVVQMGRYGHVGLFRRPGKKDREIAMACLDQVGLSALASRQIGQLSGGQQQRLFIARALAQQAPIYLMDEPFAGIDATTEHTIIEVLRTLRAEGKTIVAVHHDLQTIPEYFDWVMLMNFRLVAAGPVNEVFTPKNLQDTFGGRLTILDRVSEAMRLGAQRSIQDSSTEAKS